MPPQSMIRHIHQTWKDDSPPERFYAPSWIESWTRLNPGWEYTLWTDAMMDQFIAEEYSSFLAVWSSYPSHIMRVDAWRYLLLKARGGLYVDLDFLCLEPLDSWLPTDRIFYCGDQGDAVFCNAWMWSPQPRLPFFDGIEEALEEQSVERNVIAATGPHFLTRYADRKPGDSRLLPSEVLYPLPWHARNLTRELGRRPVEELKVRYPAAKAMTFWSTAWKSSPQQRKTEEPTTGKILIAVMSCRGNEDKRQACRESWMTSLPAGMEACFIVGGDEETTEGDTVYLDVEDGHQDGPAKMKKFYRYALEHFEFDWLFKCDDDTYVALDKLRALLSDSYDLVGSESVFFRGAPSGGAGYALTRPMIRRLAVDARLSDRGNEDVVLGSAALRYGARTLPTARLRMDSKLFPSAHNDAVTAHYCSPTILRAIHSLYPHSLKENVRIFHSGWEDVVHLFQQGFLKRMSVPDSGTWQVNDDGSLEVSWFGGEREVFTLRPPEDSKFAGLREFQLPGTQRAFSHHAGERDASVTAPAA